MPKIIQFTDVVDVEKKNKKGENRLLKVMYKSSEMELYKNRPKTNHSTRLLKNRNSQYKS